VLRPGFEHPHRLQPNERLFFGHWASLEGKTDSQQFIGLDTGCVWGRCLTIYAIESDQYFNHDCEHS
jgi:bis(5'-nucleosyl)-tetraphosphatase (symmetrical)